MRGSYTSGHLGVHLDDYVDGTLSDEESRLAARHLVACEPCRRDVVEERRILSRLREVRLDPDRHASLVSGLLALTPQDACEAARERPTRSDVALVAPSAPPHYDRARRGQLVAVVVVVAVCSGAAVTTSVPPQRTAPAAPHTAQQAHDLPDDRIATPQIAPAVRASTSNAQMVGAPPIGFKDTPSGRMGP